MEFQTTELLCCFFSSRKRNFLQPSRLWFIIKQWKDHMMFFQSNEYVLNFIRPLIYEDVVVFMNVLKNPFFHIHLSRTKSFVSVFDFQIGQWTWYIFTTTNSWHPIKRALRSTENNMYSFVVKQLDKYLSKEVFMQIKRIFCAILSAYSNCCCIVPMISTLSEQQLLPQHFKRNYAESLMLSELTFANE